MCCPDVYLSSNTKLWKLHIRELAGQKLPLQDPTQFWPGSLNWLPSSPMDPPALLWGRDNRCWEGDHMAALAEQRKLPWNFILGDRKFDMQKYQHRCVSQKFQRQFHNIIVIDGYLRFGLCRLRLNQYSLNKKILPHLESLICKQVFDQLSDSHHKLSQPFVFVLELLNLQQLLLQLHFKSPLSFSLHFR